MNNIIKPKSLTLIILSIILISTSINLNATAPSTPPALDESIPAPTSTEHKQAIQQFITEIRDIQNQVFDVAQFVLSNQTLNQKELPNINRINNNIDRLNKKITEYSTSVPSIGTQNRDILLISNALNLIKNGLYTLQLLSATNSDIERITLLDEFFRSRIAAKDTLNTVEDLIK